MKRMIYDIVFEEDLTGVNSARRVIGSIEVEVFDHYHSNEMVAEIMATLPEHIGSVINQHWAHSNFTFVPVPAPTPQVHHEVDQPTVVRKPITSVTNRMADPVVIVDVPLDAPEPRTHRKYPYWDDEDDR